MIIFDTLSQLESYEGAVKEIRTVIDVMDRSLPYDQGDGRYETPEKSSVSYSIDSFLTSDRGFESERWEGRRVLEIVLSGDALISVDGSVFRLQPGRFLVYSGDAAVRRGLSYTLPEHVKAVRFIF